MAVACTLVIATFLLFSDDGICYLQKMCRMVSSGRDRRALFVAFSAAVVADLHLLVQKPACSATWLFLSMLTMIAPSGCIHGHLSSRPRCRKIRRVEATSDKKKKKCHETLSVHFYLIRDLSNVEVILFSCHPHSS